VVDFGVEVWEGEGEEGELDEEEEEAGEDGGLHSGLWRWGVWFDEGLGGREDALGLLEGLSWLSRVFLGLWLEWYRMVLGRFEEGRLASEEQGKSCEG